MKTSKAHCIKLWQIINNRLNYQRRQSRLFNKHTIISPAKKGRTSLSKAINLRLNQKSQGYKEGLHKHEKMAF